MLDLKKKRKKLFLNIKGAEEGKNSDTGGKNQSLKLEKAPKLLNKQTYLITELVP